MKPRHAIAVLGMLFMLSARGETLTNTKGVKIEAEIGTITDDSVMLRTGPDKVYEVKRTTLSMESQKRVAQLATERAEAAKMKEAEEAEALKANEERIVKERAASIDFRGLWAGMKVEDVKTVLGPKGFAWSPFPDDRVNGYGVLVPEPGGEANATFMTLATTGDGTRYLWKDVMLLFEQGRVYSISVNSADVAAGKFEVDLKPWLKAAAAALEQKYGRPASNEIDGLSILDTKPGFSMRVAEWTVKEKFGISLRVFEDVEEPGTYMGEIQYFDRAVKKAVEDRAKKVKSGL